MEQLIDRIEAATGADRELDKAIFALVNPEAVPTPIVWSGYGWREERDHWWLATGEDARTPPKMVSPPRYTASIDAAMGLVPDVITWGVGSSTLGSYARVVTEDPEMMAHWCRIAATPALALCAAALKARESEG